jgi:hypothetical protein
VLSRLPKGNSHTELASVVIATMLLAPAAYAGNGRFVNGRFNIFVTITATSTATEMIVMDHPRLLCQPKDKEGLRASR